MILLKTVNEKLITGDVVYGEIFDVQKGKEFKWFVRANNLFQFYNELKNEKTKMNNPNKEFNKIMLFIMNHNKTKYKFDDKYAAIMALFAEEPRLCNVETTKPNFTFQHINSLLNKKREELLTNSNQIVEIQKIDYFIKKQISYQLIFMNNRLR